MSSTINPRSEVELSTPATEAPVTNVKSSARASIKEDGVIVAMHAPSSGEMDVKKNVLVGTEEEEGAEDEDDDEDMQAREYRKGNWTLNETMVLIQAKKMDYERRAQRVKEGSSSSSMVRPQEMMMRWKRVEDWCWRHGCYRSQNQCNDRWDNLMRDYNKVRAYQMSSIVEQNPSSSYWKLERHERKVKRLPSNLLPEIYEALSEVVSMKAAAAPETARPVEEHMHRLMQHQSPAPEPPLPPHPPPCTASEDRQQHPMSPERKRKRGEGSSRGRSNRHELSSAITKCASIIAEALQAGEDKEGTRHKHLITIEQRKAKLEESKTEMRIQSMEGLATAINKLASSILGLVTDRVQNLQK